MTKKVDEIKDFQLSDLDALHSEYMEQKEIFVGTEVNKRKVLIDKKFSMKKIEALLIDLEKMVIELKDLNIKSFDQMFFLNIILVIKHFTNINFSNASAIDLIRICERMVELNLVGQIMDEFDEKELKMLEEKLSTFSQNYPQLQEKFSELFVDLFDNEE